MCLLYVGLYRQVTSTCLGACSHQHDLIHSLDAHYMCVHDGRDGNIHVSEQWAVLALCLIGSRCAQGNMLSLPAFLLIEGSSHQTNVPGACMSCCAAAHLCHSMHVED